MFNQELQGQPSTVLDLLLSVIVTTASKQTRLTVYVFDHVDTEAVSGDGGEHLSSAGPPGQVVWRAPGCDGTEEKLQVVLLGQLLRRRHVVTQLHQDLLEERGDREIDNELDKKPCS